MAASMAMTVFIAVFILNLSRYFIPHIVKRVMKFFFQESPVEGSLKSQIKKLGDEQSELSVKEEFPKYARMDRKINKLKDELKKIRQSKTAKSFTVSWGLTLALNSLETFCFIFLIWRYRYEPMLILSKEWLWPLSGIVSFPCGVPGAVGITCWILICNNILRRGQAVITSTWASPKQET